MPPTSTAIGQLAPSTVSRGDLVRCLGAWEPQSVQMVKALQECIGELQQAHILWQEILTLKRSAPSPQQGVGPAAGVGQNQQNRILDQAFANSQSHIFQAMQNFQTRMHLLAA